MIKDPNAVLDFRWDWSDWLADAETISTHTVTVPTGTGGIVKDSSSDTDDTVTVWLSGGTAGVRYPILCRIVTNQGRTDDRTIYIDCRER